MNTEEKILDLLFRQVTPERILRKLKRSILLGSFEQEDPIDLSKNKSMFMDFAESTLSGYSIDEHKLLFEQIGQTKKHWEEDHILASDFLILLIQYAEKHLCIKGKDPVCKMDFILNWRSLFLALGQDLLICPYLAYQDYVDQYNRKDFTWPPVIRGDNEELYHILEKGISENHNHINGGTISFPLTWIRMMNFPQMIRKELEKFDKTSPLFAKVIRVNDDYTMDRSERLELAALIRTILFRALHRESFAGYSREIGYEEDKDRRLSFDGEEAFRKEYLNSFSRINTLCAQVDILRNTYGYRFDYPDERGVCLDYTIDTAIIQNSIQEDVRALTGERYFLYQCVQACLRNKMTSGSRRIIDERSCFTNFEENLFYLYLVIQCNFRTEMIQANGETGFHNFLNYQNRKDYAWDDNFYFWEAARMGINYPLNRESVSSLEARLVPKSDSKKNIGKVLRFDRAKRYADCSVEESMDPVNYGFDPELELDQFQNVPYFFVFHFIKKEDDRKLTEGKFSSPVCRHEKHRADLKETARGLVSSLRQSAYFRSRCRGIDAAAGEFGCRPEVFAVAYRYLDYSQRIYNGNPKDFLSKIPMKIGKVYHAGEDFQDIADGLRAIDETIEFLEFDSGSRIGHALALGVAPEDHYATKHFECVTTAQNRLDDLVWIFFRSKELGVVIPDILKSRLTEEAKNLFERIYGDTVRREKWDGSLRKYWCSMKLRADDPEFYHNKKYDMPRMEVDEMGKCLLRKNDSRLVAYRKDSCVEGLYYYYQYGVHEGIAGKETYLVKIDKAYMELMKNMQDAMMRFVESKHIAIECNPSSNVLIGTFGTYEKHPIFRFNDRKLSNSKQTQLFVSINTDDLGIFDTSLEFEYALIYQALRGQIDEKCQPVYSERDILDYLDDIREMGNRMAFTAKDNNSGMHR